MLKTGSAPRGHDKKILAEEFRKECNFSRKEMKTIIDLKELNNGPGGLRYENNIKVKFSPSTFTEGVAIVERLVSENFQS